MPRLGTSARSSGEHSAYVKKQGAILVARQSVAGRSETVRPSTAETRAGSGTDHTHSSTWHPSVWLAASSRRDLQSGSNELPDHDHFGHEAMQSSARCSSRR